MSSEEARITSWIESELGGRVTHIVRQSRWRPAWFVDVARDDDTLRLCVRGERVDSEMVLPLDHEMRLQRMLWEQGVPVPRVHGWIDDPASYVMDRVPGADDFSGATPEQRDAVMREYVETLARIHRLDVDTFADAGILRAERVEDADKIGLRQFERIYRNSKKRPDPLMEFVLDWLSRHPLRPHGRESVIVWDSGQLHHQDGRLVSLMDVELGHIGDPMMDLASLRLRDRMVGFGDLQALFAHYENAGGYPVDPGALHFHHLRFTLTAALAFHSAFAAPLPGTDYMTNLTWSAEMNRFAIEEIAQAMDLTLPEVAIPEPEDTPVAPQFAHMTNTLNDLANNGDGYESYRLGALSLLSRHQQRWVEIGPQVLGADLDDLGELLGRRPANWSEGEKALESFIMANRGDRDAELVLLFNRRLSRAQALNGPPGSPQTAHNPLQSIGPAVRWWP